MKSFSLPKGAVRVVETCVLCFSAFGAYAEDSALGPIQTVATVRPGAVVLDLSVAALSNVVLAVWTEGILNNESGEYLTEVNGVRFVPGASGSGPVSFKLSGAMAVEPTVLPGDAEYGIVWRSNNDGFGRLAFSSLGLQGPVLSPVVGETVDSSRNESSGSRPSLAYHKDSGFVVITGGNPLRLRRLSMTNALDWTDINHAGLAPVGAFSTSGDFAYAWLEAFGPGGAVSGFIRDGGYGIDLGTVSTANDYNQEVTIFPAGLRSFDLFIRKARFGSIGFSPPSELWRVRIIIDGDGLAPVRIHHKIGSLDAPNFWRPITLPGRDAAAVVRILPDTTALTCQRIDFGPGGTLEWSRSATLSTNLATNDDGPFSVATIDHSRIAVCYVHSTATGKAIQFRTVEVDDLVTGIRDVAYVPERNAFEFTVNAPRGGALFETQDLMDWTRSAGVALGTRTITVPRSDRYRFFKFEGSPPQ